MAKTSILVLLLILSSAVAQLVPPRITCRPIEACKGDLSVLTVQCAKYVEIPGPLVPPSGDCCKAIQGCDIPCICSTYVTPEVQKLISMTKVVYVAAKCDRPFAHKSKCGNYTVPAASSSRG